MAPADPVERAHLRAELDGMIAHLYGLTEDEFSHILSTFRFVPEQVRGNAMTAYRDVKLGVVPRGSTNEYGKAAPSAS